LTVGLLGWEVHSRLGGALASVLLGGAVLFAALATINYRAQRRVDHGRRGARRPAGRGSRIDRDADDGAIPGNGWAIHGS